jgi:AmmeMemoRadiSam system protein B
MRPVPNNASVRAPAVAGLFYPDDAGELRDTVVEHLARASVDGGPAPKALIAPHAGYIYSGDTAAHAYRTLADRSAAIRRVVLVGPSHRVYLRGVALPTSRAFATPLGRVEVDSELRRELLAEGLAIEADAPHALEHCLEVQLPFLQVLLGDFTILPLVGGDASAAHVGAILERLWGDPHTLIVASSDLSHYHAYEDAERRDRITCADILAYATTLTGEQACGAVALNGLAYAARRRGLHISQLARCNSGDTAGDRQRVVGYAAFALHEDRPDAGAVRTT